MHKKPSSKGGIVSPSEQPVSHDSRLGIDDSFGPSRKPPAAKGGVVSPVDAMPDEKSRLGIAGEVPKKKKR